MCFIMDHIAQHTVHAVVDPVVVHLWFSSWGFLSGFCQAMLKGMLGRWQCADNMKYTKNINIKKMKVRGSGMYLGFSLHDFRGYATHLWISCSGILLSEGNAEIQEWFFWDGCSGMDKIWNIQWNIWNTHTKNINISNIKETWSTFLDLRLSFLIVYS